MTDEPRAIITYEPDWLMQVNRALLALPPPTLGALAAGPGAVRTAFNLTPVGVQGRAQYPPTDIPTLQGVYTRNEIVYAAIQRRARSAIGPRLIVETRAAGGEWTEAAGHPFRRLWMRPNPLMDEAGFQRAGIVSMDTAGVFYVEKRRSRLGLPVELWPLNPAKVAPIPDGEGGIAAYEYKDGGAKTRIPAADMLVRREYSPTSRYHGQSPLAVCLGTVDADNAQTDFIRAFFNNAGVPSGILKITGKITQPKSDEIRAQWRAKYGRTWGQQHDVAVLDDNATYQQVGSNLDQLDSESLRSFTESRVCMVFGVPPLIIYAWVGLLRATYSNLKEAWKGFWDATLTPEYEEWRTWLMWSLLTDFVDPETIFAEQVRLRWDFTAVAALQEDEDAKQTRARDNFRAGAITLNEFRAVVGEQPDAAGDYYLRLLAYAPYPAGEPPEATTDTVLAGKRGRGPEAIRARRGRSTQMVERQITRAVQSYLAAQYKQAAAAVREQG